jgi:hypothetical protein
MFVRNQGLVQSVARPKKTWNKRKSIGKFKLSFESLDDKG